MKSVRVAVVPARGGSKRIARKNVRSFAGRPMLHHSVEAVAASRLFDRVVVSTEDSEIRQISLDAGVHEVLERPSALADDHTPTRDVILDAINQLKLRASDVVCCVYPTAPLMEPGDLKKGARIFESDEWLYVLAATAYRYPVQRSFRRGGDNGIAMLQPEAFNSRSQDLPLTYHDVGWFYFAKCETWLAEPTMFSGRSTFVEIPPNRAIDIDTEEDWELAELMWKQIHVTDEQSPHS
jgi:N-acylneuraminate cytidylyltransferase